MGGRPRQSLLWQSVQGLGDLGELRSVLAAIEPALHQDVLDLPAGGEVSEARLDPLPHLPDDRLWRLLLPGPLSGQQLVPHCPEGVDITGPAIEK